MKKSLVRIVSLLLVMLTLTGCMAQGNVEDGTTASVQSGEETSLSQQQKNTLAMLNYLALVTEQIHAASDSSLMLEEIHNALLNEFTLSAIDEDAKDYLNQLCDTIAKLQNIDSQRNYVQYIYNQEKAAAITAAIPHPLTIATLTQGGDSNGDSGNQGVTKNLVLGATLSVISAIMKYKAAADAADNNKFLGNWELDNEQRETISDSQEALFSYMWDVIHANATQDEKVNMEKWLLREDDIEQFVDICQDDNIVSKIGTLVDKEETYAQFGSYWLELVDCYFETAEYEKCLECVEKYRNLGVTIFTRDFLLVSILPKAIVAAQNVYAGEEYVTWVKAFADAIVDNSNDDEWSERYFAATAYVDLYTKTNDSAHLETACHILKGNVRQLAREQKKLNDTYLQDVKLIDISNGGTNYSQEDKDWVNAHNSALQEARKTELPTIYEPLILNCELLFVLLGELDADTEKSEIQTILHGNTDVFLCDVVSNQYSFEVVAKSYAADFNKNEFMIPANLLHQDSVVTVTVAAGGETTVFDDVTLTRVDRSGQDVNSFQAYYSSDKLNGYKWSEDANILITIDNGERYPTTALKFRVSEYKDNWIFDDTVRFEQVPEA